MSSQVQETSTAAPILQPSLKGGSLTNAPQPASQDKWTGERAFDVYSTQTRFLVGKVLTVVDAAITDKQQVKAVKDLIKQQFREQEKWVCSIFCGGQLVCAVGEEMPPTGGRDS